MKVRLGKSSIAARLTRLNLLVSGMALLLAYIAFFSYDLISFRQSLVENLVAMGEITGANSVSALLFDDPQAAENTLSALRSSPDIVYAALLTNDGRVFAQMPQRGPAPSPLMLPAPGEQQRIWKHTEHVVVAQRIAFAGKSAGILYLAADLKEMGARARHYLVIAAIILAFCLGAALTVTRSFRKTLTRPIESLAETARIVSRERDYSIRAAPSSDYDELAVLIAAFNEMLAQIQQRDAALQSVRDQLEVRVQERTAELKEANRELEAFSYTVAHDLRGPLDVVNSTSFLLQRLHSPRIDDAGKEMLGRLRQSSQEMATLIDDLLNLSRASTAPIERTSVDLSEIAQSIAGDLHRLAPERVVEFVIAPQAIASGNPGLLRVVLDNLLRNSWKYTSNHGTAHIEFGAFHRGEETVYFIRDDGAGFDPELSERLFQPFQRLHGKAEFPGTGIGLATVGRIIARHGGSVWAEGAVEQGATIYFTL